MAITRYFFDSYAVIEIVSGSVPYNKYISEPPTFTIFNLAEIYWSALNNLEPKEAEKVYEKYSQCVIEITDEVLKEAMLFRKDNKKKNLSYTDCIGYIYALRNNMKFLTGDKEFEHLENVEFVK